MNLLELDGSFGEGGGQILRTSLTLALITGRGFHLRNVRAGRDKPGLQPQHLTSVRAAATVGGATARGASRGGTDLVFEPGRVKPGTYRFDVGTAGATGLVLQTVALPLAFKTAAPSKVTLIGGTHVRTSPSFHFLDASWRGYLAAVGIEMSLRLVRAGFYPRGGGEVEAVIEPSGRLHGFRPPERGAVEAAGFAAVAGLPLEIARRMSRRAAFRLARRQVSAAFREEEWAGGPGAVFGVRLATTPAPTVFVGIGELRKSAERVADEVVDEVLAFLAAESAAVDPYSADQLLLPLALAEGSSDFGVSEVTRHLVTNAAVVRNFIDREIRVEGAEGSPGRVRIDRAS